MSTPTTTREGIRDNMISLIRALTPSKLSSDKFEQELGEQLLEDWANEYPAASFRRFAIEFTGELPTPPIAHTDIEFVEGDTVRITVCYPKQFGKYGENNIRDLRDLVDADLYSIDGRSGVGVNNPQSSYASVRTSQVFESDPESPVAFLRIEYSTAYYRSTVA